MSRIHPLAHVDAAARIADDAEIGPFCVIGPHVEIGAGVRLIANVHVAGRTVIGARTVAYPFVSLGGPPQSSGYRGEPTRLEIGEDCDLREGVTMNIGTVDGGGVTKVGARGFYMANAHVAHDCIVGDDVTFANAATLAGHCEVGDGAILGGLSAIHQFVRIGHHAFVGGMTGVAGDLIPYGMVIGNRARLKGLNIIGLKRAGASRQDLQSLRAAYRMLFDRARPVAENVELARAAYGQDARVADILDFVTARGKRMFCMPPVSAAHDEDDED